jgi:drug/metabolite transporter (DMT)-like permease
VDVVALSLVSALCFGALSVVLRLALARVPDADVGALTTALAGFAVAGVYALAGGVRLDADGAAIFAVAGLLSPGSSQLLFTFAVREVGASRTSVVTGAAPLFAVAIALVVLGEPFEIPLIVGGALIVLGGGVLVVERGRPAHFRLLGLILAAGGALVFAVRDAYVRGVSDDVDVEPAAAAAVALLTGAVAILVYMLVTRRGRLPSPRLAVPFVPVGILFGLSYLFLYEAFYRGRVSVVSPLVATEALFAVLLATLVLRRTELIGRRLVLGALLVVAGGALIGAFR